MPPTTPERRTPPTDAGSFATTHWSTVIEARDGTTAQADEALATLCHNYWAPLYAFLRRTGYSPHDAEDHVQSFFVRFFEKEWLRDVDPRKGRFRSFLLASLRHFVSNVERSNRRLRRGGKWDRINLDVPGEEKQWVVEMALQETPQQTYDRRWAETVIQNASSRLRKEMRAADRGKVFGMARKWLATDPAPGDYERAAAKLGITINALRISVFRMRSRYGELVRAEVAGTVHDGDDVDSEVRYLLDVLASD